MTPIRNIDDQRIVQCDCMGDYLSSLIEISCQEKNNFVLLKIKGTLMQI